jgi:hypothetical protein
MEAMMISKPRTVWEKVMAFAEMRGSRGFTSADAAKYIEAHPHSVAHAVNRCRSRLWLDILRKDSITLVDGKVMRRVSVYVPSAIWRMAKIELAAHECRTKRHNVAQAILDYGHDEDFRPRGLGVPTQSLVGSQERINVYRQRVEQGFEIWHPEDGKLRVYKPDEPQGSSPIRVCVSKRKFLAE